MTAYDTRSKETSEPSNEHIREFPFWINPDDQPPRFLGTHWQCEICNAMSCLDASSIDHKESCTIEADQ